MEVKIIADSIGKENGIRLTTFQLSYWRAIHSEMMTHRVFSRNASSSRAIPVAKLAQKALDEMVYPLRWGMNQTGMQASQQNLEGEELEEAKAIWDNMAHVCADGVKRLAELGLHKQHCNRALEWFSDIHVVLSATELDNFYELRDHEAAQPEIEELAKAMKDAQSNSSPSVLKVGDWHLPYILEKEKGKFSIEDLVKISSSRCARVSYLKHDGTKPNFEDDLSLYSKLVGSKPYHCSPLEHASLCMPDDNFYANFRGWKQHRKFFEEQHQ